jgi:hypothetical protein
LGKSAARNGDSKCHSSARARAGAARFGSRRKVKLLRMLFATVAGAPQEWRATSQAGRRQLGFALENAIEVY